MITKLILDTLIDGELVRAKTPVAYLDGAGGEYVDVELSDGRVRSVPAAHVEAGHEPEETVSALSEQMGINYDTLLSAVRSGRVLARKSGPGTWLTTKTAVEYAIREGRIRAVEQ